MAENPHRLFLEELAHWVSEILAEDQLGKKERLRLDKIEWGLRRALRDFDREATAREVAEIDADLLQAQKEFMKHCGDWPYPD